MDVSENWGVSPQMDGENEGKPTIFGSILVVT